MLLVNRFYSSLLDTDYSKHQGEIRIRSFSGGSDDEMWIGFSVAINGFEISVIDYPRNFERFYFGRAIHDPGASGTGLVLANVKQ